MWEGLNEIIHSKKQGPKLDKNISVRNVNWKPANTNEIPDIYNNCFTSVAKEVRSEIRQNENDYRSYLGQ